MNHATLEQIYDHAYGFQLSDHVASCSRCGGTADAVAAEREALRGVLAGEPENVALALGTSTPPAKPRRSRIGPPAVAAAALFLGALAWLLYQPTLDRSPAAGQAPGSQEEEIRRLIGELGSPSPLRKELARVALLRYGGTAIPALERSGQNPDLVEQIRGVTPADRALQARLTSTRVTVKVEHALYTEVLDLLKPHLGAVTADFSEHRLETAFVTLSYENAPLIEVIKGLAAQMKVPFGVRSGALLLGKRPEPEALAPVRFPTREAEVARQIENLSTESWAPRKEAERALGRLGFGAEPALWAALEGKSPETRELAARLLRNLYRPPETTLASPSPSARALPPVTIDAVDRPLSEVISAIIAQGGGFPVIWEDHGMYEEPQVSFRGSGIPMDAALRMLLGPRGAGILACDSCILVMAPGSVVRRCFPVAERTPPPHTLWLKASQAQEAEARISDLVSSDRTRQERARVRFREMEDSSSLAILACAAGVLEGNPLRRCQALRQEIAADASLWICDLPSGADLQTLSAAQQAILNSSPASTDRGTLLRLEQILENEGIRATFKAGQERHLGISGKGLTISTLLKITLRPRGFDFYLDGDTVVVDTAANVRTALEK